MEYENERVEVRWVSYVVGWGVFPRVPLQAGYDLGLSWDTLPVTQDISEYTLQRGEDVVDTKGSLIGYFNHADAEEANCCLGADGRIVVEKQIDVDTELRFNYGDFGQRIAQP